MSHPTSQGVPRPCARPSPHTDPDARRHVTQFITDDGTDTGKLVEMRRFYIQARVALHSAALHSASGRRLPTF